MRVLIADDDKDQLFVRSMLLRQNGFEPIEAQDARVAIEKAAVYKPECAIIDLRLPTEEVGFGLIRELKKLDSTIHVIVLTGGDARRLSTRSENDLIDEIVVKGSPSTHMIRKLKAIAAGLGALL
jgi:DNA-binding response OmpR family regulator